jgi:hypothetical protein
MFRRGVLPFDSKLDFSVIETSHASSLPSFLKNEEAIPTHQAPNHGKHDALQVLEV